MSATMKTSRNRTLMMSQEQKKQNWVNWKRGMPPAYDLPSTDRSKINNAQLMQHMTSSTAGKQAVAKHVLADVTE